MTHVYECACVCMRGWQPSDRYLCGLRRAACLRRASALSPLVALLSNRPACVFGVVVRLHTRLWQGHVLACLHQEHLQAWC